MTTTKKALLCLDGTLGHLWRIEPPGGPTSQGVCQNCGEQKVFSNVDAAYRSYNGPAKPQKGEEQ